jgi:hypothetical protein
MPDVGEINRGHFKNQEYVFSGHFHKRQRDGNVIYIGNPFGHNYSDAGDKDRGCMVLEWGGKPEFINWAESPNYISTKLSKLIEDPSCLNSKSYVKCETDMDVSYLEATQIREALLVEYNLREFKLVSKKDEIHEMTDVDVTNMETVDQMVLSELKTLEDGKYKQAILTSIYNGLE